MEAALESFSEASRAIVRTQLYGPTATGSIPADEVAALARAEAITVEELLVRLLPVAQEYSRPPLSNFKVGAVALGASGAMYLGANIEFPGQALNQAVHAEQAAVANAFAHEERGIQALAITAPPCGHCRQFLNEIRDAAGMRILVHGHPVRTMADLLPEAFGPRNLGMPAGLLDTPPASLRLAAAGDALTAAALDAAARSYAPHSRSRSGCAVMLTSGRVFAGSYLENAAYNPSLSPLQAALVNVMCAREDFAAIRRVVLVEVQDAAISQRASTECVLAAVAPAASLDVLTAL